MKSLVINFCGAFARTDVMADGVVKAWEKLKPTVPVFFSIHGTGEDEAVKLVRERLEASSPTISWKTPCKRRSRRRDDHLPQKSPRRWCRASPASRARSGPKR